MPLAGLLDASFPGDCIEVLSGKRVWFCNYISCATKVHKYVSALAYMLVLSHGLAKRDRSFEESCSLTPTPFSHTQNLLL